MKSTRIVRRFACALAVLSTLVASGVFAQRAPKISQDQINAMFANMRAHAPWNVDGPLLWSFFFFFFFFLDADKTKLQSVGADLTALGYRLVYVVPTRAGDRF
jgi:hypothetical protein